jgi:hypothetical protein
MLVANDKGGDEIFPRDVHISPGICFTAEENSGRRQVKYRLMKELCD